MVCTGWGNPPIRHATVCLAAMTYPSPFVSFAMCRALSLTFVSFAKVADFPSDENMMWMEQVPQITGRHPWGGRDWRKAKGKVLNVSGVFCICLLIEEISVKLMGVWYTAHLNQQLLSRFHSFTPPHILTFSSANAA